MSTASGRLQCSLFNIVITVVLSHRILTVDPCTVFPKLFNASSTASNSRRYICSYLVTSGHAALVNCAELFPVKLYDPCNVAPHAVLLASVEIVNLHIAVRGGGPHRLPIS